MIRFLDATVLPMMLGWVWVAERIGYVDQAKFVREAVAWRRKDAEEEREYFTVDRKNKDFARYRRAMLEKAS